MENRLKVDFHFHSLYSGDSVTRLEELIAAARKAGLDRLVLTDHNELRGALEAQALAPDLIIPGEEVLTTRGELLASFVSERVPKGLEPMEAIQRLKDQGAFISVSHPFDYGRYGWEMPDLLAILPYVDAIEVFNARCLSRKTNDLAFEFAQQHGLAGTAGSDGHTAREAGRGAALIHAFKTADELRIAIKEAEVVGKLSSPWVHVSSSLARLSKQIRK